MRFEQTERMVVMAKRIIGLAVGLSVFIFSTMSCYALTWTCTGTDPTYYWDEGSISFESNGAYCTTADITGSVSAAISQADKDYIVNTILNSTILSSIRTYSLNAQNMLNGSSNGGKSLALTYDKANTAATNAANAKASADKAAANALLPDTIKVVKGQAFTEVVRGVISGSASGVSAVPITGTICSRITGTASTFASTGVFVIKIGGNELMFKVIDAPNTSYSAQVNFGS